jgi:putative copper resistance protein D
MNSLLKIRSLLLSFGILLFALAPLVWAQDHSKHDGYEGHEGHAGMSPSTDENAVTPAMQAKLLADKKESEFNHHLAGFFVVLAGVFLLLQDKLAKSWPAVKFVWPACFLLSGIFVLIWSDTELWPFGNRQWLEALQNNREVLQHKTFAVLLLALGAIEWKRATRVLKSVWSGWVFPAVAIGGSLLLLLHAHEAGMHGPNHMELMARIQSEHLSYSIVGIGIGLATGLAQVKTRWQPIFGKLQPLLMIVLGVLLMFYRE